MPVERVIEPETFFSENGSKFDAVKLAKKIGKTSLLLSLNPWHTDSVDELIALLNPSETVGFFPGFSTRLPLDFTKHSSDLAFDVVKKIAPHLQIEEFSSPPELRNQYDDFALHLRKMIPDGARCFAVHGDTKPDKIWADERFSEVIEWLLQRDREAFVFDLGLNCIGGSRFENHERVISCRELILPSAIALVGLTDFFIGVDSCFLHAADLYGIPGIGLFGATKPFEFGFRFGPHRHISGKNSMDDISVESVISAIVEMENDLHFSRNGGVR